jgi:hypothetical protein
VYFKGLGNFLGIDSGARAVGIGRVIAKYMNNIIFSNMDGKILLDGEIIAPLSLSDFMLVSKKMAIIHEETRRKGEWRMVRIDVNILKHKFWMYISFVQNEMKLCQFYWNGGILNSKGFEVTVRELLADKNSLTKLFSEALGVKASKRSYNFDVFSFEWGSIENCAAIQTPSVIVEMEWKSKK